MMAFKCLEPVQEELDRLFLIEQEYKKMLITINSFKEEVNLGTFTSSAKLSRLIAYLNTGKYALSKKPGPLK